MSPYSVFDGVERLASGSLAEATIAVKRAHRAGAGGPLLVFDDGTGRVVDVDTRGTNAEIMERLAATSSRVGSNAQPEDADGDVDDAAAPRRRGRPRLGVVAREVTLLPRHWEWLNAQPGGASVALRKLVEAARRVHAERDRTRDAHERAYRFLLAVGGDLPGFEEVSRALFAGDRGRLEMLLHSWPPDVAAHAMLLAHRDPSTADEVAR